MIHVENIKFSTSSIFLYFIKEFLNIFFFKNGVDNIFHLTGFFVYKLSKGKNHGFLIFLASSFL